MKRFLYIFLSILITLNICFILYMFINDHKKYDIKHNYIAKLKGNKIITLNIGDEYEENGINLKIDKQNNKYITNNLVDNTKEGLYVVSYEPKDYYLNFYRIYRLVKVVDNTPPTIKLNGGQEIIIYLNDKFEDPGATAVDAKNNDLSDKIEIEGTVDNKKVGTYEIKYSVVDKNGNLAEAIRKVVVKEKSKVTKVSKSTSSEKGTASKKSLDLTKNSNTVTEMNFTNTGFYIKGYVKKASNTYTLKLCSNNNCTSTKMTANKNYYSGNINLTQLANGTYNVKIVASEELDVIDELPELSQIVRAKIGNKLVTFTYNNKKPTVKIEDFAYAYDIVIDPGHGGSDSGAVNSKIQEKALNLTQSLYEKNRYEEHGLKVFMIRTNDTYGVMMGSKNNSNIHRRALAIGYYGVVSKYVYSNHHNSTSNKKYSGWEIILTNQGSKSIYEVPFKIAEQWRKQYPLKENHLRIYGRNYSSDSLLTKENGQTYNIKNWYAVHRIPYELFNVYNVTYEGSYLSNMDDYNWYIDNWKKLSEIKIKYYVEALGKKYISNGIL